MPRVSIIVPCYNEQDTIVLLLDALYAQDYDHQEMEVIIADGQSTDRTRDKIVEFTLAHPDFDVKVIDNPARIIPAGLNRAIEAAGGEIIVRLDAHSAPRPDYVSRCVAGLEGGLGQNVGGVWDIQPRGEGWQAQSIAAAASHPFGVGDALYRYSERAQAVDTVPFGAFRRELIEKIGNYNENLLANEDYEFNLRVRQSGGTVWLDPAIRSIYYARPTFRQLARQYWGYGYWKVQMLRHNLTSIRLRQAAPPLFVLGILLGGVLAFWFPWILGLGIAGYLVILTIASVDLVARKRNLVLLWGVPLAMATMHISYGGAFLWSLLILMIPGR